MNALSWCFLFGPFVLLVAVVAIGVAIAAAPGPSYGEQIDAWHAQRLQSLTAESGWLTLVGLHWLKPGENRVGSDPSAPVRIDSRRVPADAGTLVLANGEVRLRPRAGSGITLAGKPVTGETVLKTDAEGTPDVLKIGRVSFQVIRRGDRFGVRVKDPEAPTRVHFKGLEYFPTDPAWRIEARFVPFATPREISVPTAIGTTETSRAPGLLEFTIGGREYTLMPFLEEPGGPLFIVFSDGTAGLTTYGAGRFLYTDPPKDGKVVIDFNRAYNPPCAFTSFATCPLPPRENRLHLDIPAGEKKYAGGH